MYPGPVGIRTLRLHPSSEMRDTGRPFRSAFRLVSATLTLAVLGLFALTGCGGDSDESAPSGSAVAQPTVEPAPETIKSSKLASEYDLDEAAADARFKGKEINVTGMIVTFGTNKDNVSYVNLQGGGTSWMPGTAVQCLLTESGLEALSRVRVTKLVTIRGTVEGFGESVKDADSQFALFISTGSDLTISDCSVLP